MLAEQIKGTLPSGWVRALWPGEEERLVGHLLRLSPEDRQSRFLAAADEGVIRRHIARVRGKRWQVIGWFEAGVLRAAVELVVLGDTAEAALTTEAGYRRRGIARRLLERASRRAALAGAKRLVLVTSRSNHATIRLARAAGADCVEQDGEVMAELPLSRPDAFSLCRDLFEERRGQIASATAQMFPLATQAWSAVQDAPG